MVIAQGMDRSIDREVLSAAALTHDVRRVMGNGSVVPPESLDRVREVLEAAGFDGDIDSVLHCVEVHEEYGFQEGRVPGPDTIGAEITQDADNLDAVGPVGVAKILYPAGDHGNPGTALHEKFQRLDSALDTELRRRRAWKRISQMREFVEAFEQDWKAGQSF